MWNSPDVEAVDGIVVELKGVPQIDERTFRHADVGVDLFAAVLARIAEREPSLGVERRLPFLDQALRDRRRSCSRSPGRRRPRPRATSHARMRSPTKCPSMRGRENDSRMTPSNSPRPPICDAAGRRTERGHDARQQAVAFLPVDARHVKGHLRLLAPRRAAAEVDVGTGRSRPIPMSP